jgi:hypothetical protein
VKSSGSRFRLAKVGAMGARRQNITVSHSYKPAPEECSQALALLLKAPVRKEAAHPAASNEAKGLKDARPARTILPR